MNAGLSEPSTVSLDIHQCITKKPLALEPYLEDHPRTGKWLISMVIVSALSGFVPLTNGRFMAYKWGFLTTYKSWYDPARISASALDHASGGDTGEASKASQSVLTEKATT